MFVVLISASLSDSNEVKLGEVKAVTFRGDRRNRITVEQVSIVIVAGCMLIHQKAECTDQAQKT